MIDTKLRGKIQPVFDQVGRGFVYLKIKPNQITVAALLFGLFAGGLIAFGYLIPALLFLWLSGFLDVLDGTVARIMKKSSNIGAFLDLIFDRLVEAGIVMGFFFLRPDDAFFYLLFFVSVLFNFSTFMVAGALFQNTGSKSMHYDIGLAERTETFLCFSAMLIWVNHSAYILFVFTLLIFLTGIIRFFES
jgi:archaetidylinositol phosphate synthase